MIKIKVRDHRFLETVIEWVAVGAIALWVSAGWIMLMPMKHSHMLYPWWIGVLIWPGTIVIPLFLYFLCRAFRISIENPFDRV